MTAAQLADARRSTEANLTDTCTIQTYSMTDSGYGVASRTANDPVVVKCKVQQKLYTKPVEEVSGAELNQISDYLVKLPWDTVISPKDNIITSGGVLLEVLDVPDISTERYALNVDCKRIFQG